LWGCFREALFTTDVQQQARLYEAACQQGSGPACYALAQPAYRRPPDVRRSSCARPATAASRWPASTTWAGSRSNRREIGESGAASIRRGASGLT